MIVKIRTIVAFCSAALLIAWAGAYLDTFVLPLDATSSNALGSPEFAYATILGIKLAFAVLGSIMFGATCLLSQGNSPAPNALTDLLAFAYGAAYSVAIFGLGRISGWAGWGAAAVLMWVAILVLPIAIGRRLACSEIRSHQIGHRP